MKFICDKCSAKYSIADEKIRKKVLKIRCKKCSHVIIVRDPQARAAQSCRVCSRRGSQPPQAGEPMWNQQADRGSVSTKSSHSRRGALLDPRCPPARSASGRNFTTSCAKAKGRCERGQIDSWRGSHSKPQH